MLLPRSAMLTALLGLAACGGETRDATSGASTGQTPVITATRSTAKATPADPTPTPAATAARGASRSAPVRAPGSTPTVSTLATGLVVPWDIAFLPDGRALVTERPGRIRMTSSTGKLAKPLVARVATQARGEGGLLGIAIDPQWARGKRFAYVYVTTATGMEVQRYRWRAGNALVRDGVVLKGIAAGSIHDSGRLRFGPDGALYLATGDGGQRERAQQRSSLNGKILRLTRSQYRGSTTKPQLYALGVRNPQGLAWSPKTGRLTITDHGPSGFDGPGGNDEVNVIVRGGNYGWPRASGRDAGGFRGPAQLYPKAIAPSGATFVTRKGSSWTNDFVLAALKGRALHRLTFKGSKVVNDQTLLAEKYGRLRAVVEAPDGALWVTTSNRDTYGSPVSKDDDRILRVLPPK